MRDLKRIFSILLLMAGLLFAPAVSYAYSQNYFKEYKPTVPGFGNRLSLANILKITSLPASQAKALLKKAGYKEEKSSGSLYREDFYAQDSDHLLYQIGFKEGTKGFRKLIIYTQPEMRFIESDFLAAGFTMTRVKPRKGARWTKVYQKKGYPTYSMSMLLLPGMEHDARYYNFDDYVYCLICEKNT